MQLILDTRRGVLYDKLRFGHPTSFRDLEPMFRGDQGPCSIYLGENRGGIFYTAEYDPDDIEVYICRPVAETVIDFRVTYLGQTTDWIPVLAHRHVVSAAINALSTIAAAGGVVVFQGGVGNYLLVWKTADADSTITIEGRTADELVEVAAFESAAAGYPAARISFFEDVIAHVAAINTETASLIRDPITAGPYYQDIIYFDREPQDGFFNLSHNGGTTLPISVFASAQQVQDALESISPGIFRVRKHGEFAWQVNRITGDVNPVSLHQGNVISYHEMLGNWTLTGRGLALIETGEPIECAVVVSHTNKTLFKDAAVIIPNHLATVPGEEAPANVAIETVEVPLLAGETSGTITVPVGYEIADLIDIRLEVAGAGVTGELAINDHYESGGDIVVRLRGVVENNDEHTLVATFMQAAV